MEIKTTKDIYFDCRTIIGPGRQSAENIKKLEKERVKWVRVDDVIKYIEKNEFYDKLYFFQQLKRELSVGGDIDGN